MSANRSISAWVTSRQSLGPMVRPTSSLSSSIPFTVMVMHGTLLDGPQGYGRASRRYGLPDMSGFLSRGFIGRRRTPEELRDRLPPGQYFESGFPVLTAGPTPQIDTSEWGFR